jgi:hypothetical protein
VMGGDDDSEASRDEEGALSIATWEGCGEVVGESEMVRSGVAWV